MAQMKMCRCQDQGRLRTTETKKRHIQWGIVKKKIASAPNGSRTELRVGTDLWTTVNGKIKILKEGYRKTDVCLGTKLRKKLREKSGGTSIRLGIKNDC